MCFSQGKLCGHFLLKCARVFLYDSRSYCMTCISGANINFEDFAVAS
jgi:hypothetical protein